MIRPQVLSRLRLGLTVLTFILLAWYGYTRPHFHLSTLALRWEYLAWACLCLPPMLYLRAAKWRILLMGAAPDVTWVQAARSYLGAMALGLVTPARLGEFSRGMYLPQRVVQGWRGAGLVLIDNWIDFLAVLIWACLGWAVCFGLKGLILGGVLVLVFSPISAWLRMFSKGTSRVTDRWHVRETAQKALTAGDGIKQRDWLQAMGAGIAAYGFEWLQMALLLAFLAPAVSTPWRLAGMMALVALANSFQVTLAGLGIREGISMVLLAKEGVGNDIALLAAFLQTLLILLLPAMAGLFIRPVALYQNGDEKT